MSALYQKAMDYPYVDENGVKRAKFVNLDMEEYKDAHFTLRLFKEVLNKPEFKNYSAGIVVQAYLPDAYEFQTELLDFARERVARGGAPVKMRLVKGCNLEMETVISSLRGWPNPVRTSKTEVDANYLHILERALQPGNAKVLHVGVASHNLFTIAYAYLLSQKLGSAEYMTFEMLEGMAVPCVACTVSAWQSCDSLCSGGKRRAFSQCCFLFGAAYGRKYGSRQFPYSLV